MKKMIIKKYEAQGLAEFLEKIEVMNKLSRLRTKFIKKLVAITVELEEDRVALCEEYSNKDNEGNPIVIDNVYSVNDREELDRHINELKSEELAIEAGEYSSNFKPLFDFLDSEAFVMTLSGQDAVRYDRLLDIWEDAQEDNEEEK